MPPRDERLVYDVIRLDKSGTEWRAIARALRISRDTVRQIMAAHNESRDEQHPALVRPPQACAQAESRDTAARTRRDG